MDVVAFIPVIGMSVLGSLAYFLKEKKKYKTVKKTIYAVIRKSIDELDFEMLADGVQQLKDFDKRFTNINTGQPQKKIAESMFRMRRDFKMDKFEQLFNIPKEVVEDVESIREHFMGRRSNPSMLSSNLNNIIEEEKKETMVVRELKVKLEKVKRRQLARNNEERKVLDALNFTDKIQELHKEYEDLFIETFEQEKDLQNILQRGMKKQMILKRMRQIQEKKGNDKDTNISC